MLLAPAFRLHERWMARLTPADLARWEREGSVEVHHHATNRPRRIGWAFFEDAARWPAFPVVKVPALCIAGRRDDTVPLEDVQAWVDRTPGARLEVVDDGHELTGSLERIVALTREFLGDAPRTRAAPRTDASLDWASSSTSSSTSERYLRSTRLKLERSMPALRAAAEMLLSQARMSAST